MRKKKKITSRVCPPAFYSYLLQELVFAWNGKEKKSANLKGFHYNQYVMETLHIIYFAFANPSKIREENKNRLSYKI